MNNSCIRSSCLYYCDSYEFGIQAYFGTLYYKKEKEKEKEDERRGKEKMGVGERGKRGEEKIDVEEWQPNDL